MSRKRRGKSKTEMELIDMLLTRRISIIPDWNNKNIKAIRKYYWEKLVSWDGTKNCLATVQAVISCAIDSKSLFYANAHDWIAEKIKEPGVESFLVAVCILTAHYFPNRRSQILDEILDRHILGLSGTAYKLWQLTREKNLVSWNQIQSVFKLGFDWNAWPIIREATGELSEKSEDIFWACHWITENPKEEELVQLIQKIYDDPQMKNCPKTRKKIIETLLFTDSENVHVAGIIDEYFDFSIYAQEIAELLLEPSPPDDSDENKKQRKRYYQGLFDLASLFIHKAKDLKEDHRHDLIKKLLSADDHPWIFEISVDLCKLGTQYDNLSQFLCNLIFPSENRRWSDDCRNMFEDNYIRRRRELIFNQVIPFLSPEMGAETLKLLLHTKGNHDFTNLSEFSLKMKENSGIYQKTLGQLVNFGEVGIAFLVSYLDVMGDAAKNELIGWLKCFVAETYRSSSEKKSYFNKLVLNYIIPWGISAGNLILENSAELIKLGYSPTPEDVGNIVYLESLLPGTIRNGKKVFESAPEIWENPEIRMGIFNNFHSYLPVFRSLVATAEGISIEKKDRLQWLEEILISECEKNERLKTSLCYFAWNDKLADSEAKLARLLLMPKERHLWLGDNHKRQKEHWMKKKWMYLFEYEPEVADVFLSTDEQKQLFFVNAIDEDKHIWISSKKVAHLFFDDKSRAELSKWLWKNLSRINLESWVDWVIVCKLYDQPKIRRRLKTILNKCYYDHSLVPRILKILS